MEKVASFLKLNRKKKLAYVLRMSSLVAILLMIVVDTQIIFNFITGDRTFPRRITASSQTVAEALDAERTKDRFLIHDSLNRYLQDNHTYPSSLSLLVPSYISKLPVDPVTTQKYNYEVLKNGMDYKLCVNFETGSKCFTQQTTP